MKNILRLLLLFALAIALYFAWQIFIAKPDIADYSPDNTSAINNDNQIFENKSVGSAKQASLALDALSLSSDEIDKKRKLTPAEKQRYNKLFQAIENEIVQLEPNINLEFRFTNSNPNELLEAVKIYFYSLNPIPFLSYECNISSNNDDYKLNIILKYRDYYIYQQLDKAKNPNNYIKYQVYAEQIDDFIAENIKEGMSDFEKEKIIYDHIVRSYSYDNSLENYTVNSMLSTGKGICQAYAELFFVYAQKIGLDIQIVNGTARQVDGSIGTHAWNLIKLGDNYYHVDSTWGRLIKLDGGDTVDFQYFNLSDEQLAKDHNWKKENYPTCNSNEYNYFVYQGLIANSEEQLAEIVRQSERDINVIKLNFAYEDFDSVLDYVSKTYGAKGIKYTLNNNVLYLEMIK